MGEPRQDPYIWRWRIAAIAWMALIFLFSSSVFAPTMEFDSTEDWFGDLNYVVRKCAHLAEYGVLMLLVFRGLWTVRDNFGLTVVVAALVTIAYATTDEYHQSLIPARSGKASDVLFDSTGAALVALVLSCLRRSASSGPRDALLGPLAADEETEIRRS